MTDLTIEEVEGGVIFETKIVPGSSRTSICGPFDGMLKIRVSAAPEKGKANKHLLEFLAKQLGVKKNAISIISGQRSPIKAIQVLGVSGQTLLRRLNLIE
ncbi:MAG: DUF167 domain-containing protein [Planctomycetota bacterium]|jgi:uncharacterized protein (TIGR00251 family)